MYIRFWGTRGSIPTPGRKTFKYGGNTSCIEVRTNSQILIFDAGTGIRELGNHLLEEFKGKSITAYIFLSHTHWDHIQGIPFFVPFYIPNNKFTIYGPHGTELGIKKVLKRQMERDFFPVPFTEMKSNINFIELDKGISLGSAKIDFYRVNHPGATYAYKVTVNDKFIVYTSDNEPIFRKVNKIVDNEEKVDIITETDEGLVKFIKDADIAICDSQYTMEEYKKSKVGWGHSSYNDVVNLAVKGNVKKLVLFHHDPAHTDDFVGEIVESAKNILRGKNNNVVCVGAEEGMEITV